MNFPPFRKGVSVSSFSGLHHLNAFFDCWQHTIFASSKQSKVDAMKACMEQGYSLASNLLLVLMYLFLPRLRITAIDKETQTMKKITTLTERSHQLE